MTSSAAFLVAFAAVLRLAVLTRRIWEYFLITPHTHRGAQLGCCRLAMPHKFKIRPGGLPIQKTACKARARQQYRLSHKLMPAFEGHHPNIRIERFK